MNKKNYINKEKLEYAKRITEEDSKNKWVLELFILASKMGLFPSPSYNDGPCVKLLDIPKEYKKPLLDYTSKNGLIIDVYETGRMAYTGVFKGRKDPAGIMKGPKTISIYPASKGTDISGIYHTMEIKP